MIVKARYIGGWNSKPKIKAHLRYITHRPNTEGLRSARELFTYDNETTEKLSTYEAIDNAPRQTMFLKLIISPDPKREDTFKDLDLRMLTDKVMLQLMELVGEKLAQQLKIVAAEHNDHTPNRHIHAIALVPGRLSKANFHALPLALREAAREEALSQREERDLVYAQQQAQEQGVKHTLFTADGVHRLFGRAGTVATPLCPRCGQTMSMDGFCFSCGLDLDQEQDQNQSLTLSLVCRVLLEKKFWV